MGLFSNLKNFVTGGGAKVSLEVVDKVVRGSAVVVRIKAEIGDSDIELEHVSVQIHGTEKVSIPNVEVAKTVDKIVQAKKQTVDRSVKTFEAESELASNTTLKANQSYTWDAKIDLPDTVLPTFIGTNAKHTWQAKASLVMRGNDPDTGWLDFEVS